MDRDPGPLGRTLFHGIIDTHVLHHYISTIPFYHATEATAAIKPVMGSHYRSDRGRKGKEIWTLLGGKFLAGLWHSSRWCQWIECSEGAVGEGKAVMFYRNRNGLGVPPMKMKG